MQNPVVTLVWAASLSSCILPLVTFAVETGEFTQGFSKPEAILALTYTIFAFLCDILGPSWFDAMNLFKFYDFRISFMYKYDLVGWAFFAVYFGALTATRRIWDRHERRTTRITPHQL